MRRTFVQIFKHFDENFVIFLRHFLEKLVRNCKKIMQLLIAILISTLFPSLGHSKNMKQVNMFKDSHIHTSSPNIRDDSADCKKNIYRNLDKQVRKPNRYSRCYGGLSVKYPDSYRIS